MTIYFKKKHPNTKFQLNSSWFWRRNMWPSRWRPWPPYVHSCNSYRERNNTYSRLNAACILKLSCNYHKMNEAYVYETTWHNLPCSGVKKNLCCSGDQNVIPFLQQPSITFRSDFNFIYNLFLQDASWYYSTINALVTKVVSFPIKIFNTFLVSPCVKFLQIIILEYGYARSGLSRNILHFISLTCVCI